MMETFKCFVYGENVTVVDGVCQGDCSIEECNLNRDNRPDYEEKTEGAGSGSLEDQ